MNTQRLWTKDFLSISISSFFLFMGFYILLTTLPIYVLEDLHGDETQVGLIISVFLFAAVLCRPFTGKWIDELGRKKILLFSMVLFFLSTTLYLWTDSLLLLLALRFIHGIGFGMATTATGTIVVDLIPTKRRGEGMGYYAMFMNLAMVLGPFIGLTIIEKSSFHYIFILCIVLAALALLISFLIRVPSSPPREKQVAKEKFALSSLFEKTALSVSIPAGILAFAYAGILSFISVYARDLGLVKAASFFFVVYAGFILISRPFTGRWFDLYGENKIIYPAVVLFAVGIFLLSQATSTFTFLLAGALIGLGYGTIVPCFQTLAVKKAPRERRGVATATFFTIFDIGIGLGSYVLGIVASITGLSKLYFLLVGVILLGMLVYYLLHGRKTQAEQISLKEINNH